MNVDLFKKLFLLRQDIYARQTEDGQYIQIKEPITDDVIQQHLNGDQTIGLYQLQGSKIRWACLDIDLVKDVWSAKEFNIDDWEEHLKEQVDIAKEILDNKNVPHYVEHSGHKGYHIWIFFKDPVEASIVRDGMHQLFDNMEHAHDKIEWEIFPKQSRVTGNSFGNLVKGVCGYHHKSGKFSYFIDDIDPDNIQWAKASYLYDIEPFKLPIQKCRALKAAWDQAIKTGQAPHNLRLYLGNLFSNLPEEGQQWFVDEFLMKMDNYDPYKSRKHFESLEGNKPPLCETLQTEQICAKQCEAIENANSPIAFYHWEKNGKVRSKKGLDGNFDKDIENPLLDYYEESNCYFKRRHKKADKLVSTFVVELEEVYNIESDMKVLSGTIWKGKLKTGTEEVPFEESSDTFAETPSLRKFIYEKLNPTGLVFSSASELQLAINGCNDVETTVVRKAFGFEYKDESPFPDKYMTPSVIIDKNGIRTNDEAVIDLRGENEAEHLDMKDISDEDYNKTIENIRNDLLDLLDFDTTHSVLAYAALPVVFPFIRGADGDHTRFTLWLQGTTGKGKSYLLRLFQHFYGEFSDVPSWSSTTNSLQRIGYFFKDALFVVDDFKKRLIEANGRNSYKQAINLVQNYADGTGRSRMQQNLELATTFKIRGWLASTGEDIVQGEASALARIMNIRSTYKGPKKIDKGDRCMKMKKYYSGVMPRFISHCFTLHPTQFSNVYSRYLDEFLKIASGMDNDIRIARNFALLSTVHKFFTEFLYPAHEAKEIHKKLLNKKKDTIRGWGLTVSSHSPSERFVETLNQLLSTGKTVIQLGYNDPVVKDETNRYADPIGFYSTVRGRSGSHANIIMDRALEVIQRNIHAQQPIAHSKQAIIDELYEQGKIIDESEQKRKMNERNVNIVRFKPGILEPTTD